MARRKPAGERRLPDPEEPGAPPARGSGHAARRSRVVVVADDALARAGLAALLAGERDLEVSGQGPVSEAAAFAADADLVAWSLGPGESLAPALARLEAPVVALVWDDSQASEALAGGARGVLLRDVEPERISATLRAVARGLLVLDPGLQAALLRPRREPERLVEPLTAREHEVLHLLAEGLSNKSIGARLGISEHTAKFHVNAILGKLGAETRTEALAQAARLGLVLL